MARFLLIVRVLVLGLAVGWAGAFREQAKPSGESPPTVTLRTVIAGTCQEIQRYAESVVGTGVMRSAAEVHRGGAHLVFIPLPAHTTASTVALFINRFSII